MKECSLSSKVASTAKIAHVTSGTTKFLDLQLLSSTLIRSISISSADAISNVLAGILLTNRFNHT